MILREGFLVLAPRLEHAAHVLRVLFKTKVRSHQESQHKDRARRDANYFDELAISISRLHIARIEAPPDLEKPGVGVTMKRITRPFVQKALHQAFQTELGIDPGADFF